MEMVSLANTFFRAVNYTAFRSGKLPHSLMSNWVAQAWKALQRSTTYGQIWSIKPVDSIPE